MSLRLTSFLHHSQFLATAISVIFLFHQSTTTINCSTIDLPNPEPQLLDSGSATTSTTNQTRQQQCKSSSDCGDPNSTCAPNRVCKCNFGFILLASSSSSNCVRLNCIVDSDCHAHFSSHSICEPEIGECICPPTRWYRLDPDTQTCVGTGLVTTIFVVLFLAALVFCAAAYGGLIWNKIRRRRRRNKKLKEEEDNNQNSATGQQTLKRNNNNNLNLVTGSSTKANGGGYQSFHNNVALANEQYPVLNVNPPYSCRMIN